LHDPDFSSRNFADAGRDAADNAYGSAAVLALAERFKRKPLMHHRVKIAFWDLEERGLLGATAYVEQNSEKPALYINFDAFGWGNTLLMSPDISGIRWLPPAEAQRRHSKC
jgi:aminopeptidase S